jgi:hypothetical protein
MYAWVWRHLPGTKRIRIATSLTLVAGVCALLWFFAFPSAEPLLPFDDVQVGTGTEVVPGEDVIPYPTHTNNPAPDASPSVAG